jgi:hypothetical protein
MPPSLSLDITIYRDISAVKAEILLAVLAFSWTTWSFPSLPITKNGALNPIGRLSGSLVFALAGVLPLLLDAGWRAGRSAES